MATFGSTTVARLQAVLDADTSSFDRKMKQSKTHTQKFGAIAKTALIGGVAAGITAVGVAAKIGWDEYNQGAQVAAQTNAAIKSTGGIAGITAKHVEALGDSMLKLTGIDDEATKSAENQLLTFTNIGKKGGVFDKATMASADLATRLNGGTIPSFEKMNSTAILVGKALNNPTNGLTRLKRVGVEFTDQQTAQITKLQESGKTVQAQAVILKVLEEQYGGSAKAAGETFSGSITKLHERLNNFLGDLVAKAIPYIQRFIKWIGPYAHRALVTTREVVAHLRESFERFGETLNKHRTTIDKVVKVLGVLAQAIIFLWKWEIKIYLVILDIWLKILDVTLKVTDKIISAFGKVIHFGVRVKDTIADAADAVARFFQAVWNGVQRVLGPISKLADIFGGIKGAVSGAAGAVTGFFGDGIVSPMAANPGGLNPRILDDLALSQGFGLTLTSGYRPGSITSSGNPSLHGVGRAIDVAGSESAMRRFFLFEAARGAATGLAEVIHSPYWWHPSSGIGRITDSKIMADHYSHVHVGTYDKGGYLRPGWNLAYNGTGRPEPVGGGITVNVGGSVIAERDLRSLIARLDTEHRRRGGR